VTPLALGLAVMVAVMAVLWLLQRRTGNAGVVDAGWSAGVGLVGALAAALGAGWAPRRLLVGTMIALWSLRLAVYILRRVLGEREDGRYTQLRSEWGAAFQGRLFWFYQTQAVLAALFALPVWVVAADPRPGWGARELAAVVLWLVAVLGESLADRQLARFRADPANRGRTCTVGLWRTSRHPNYFFEWLHWWAYVVLALGAPLTWLTLVGPALMLFFLLKVTGVPATEARALLSRPDYAEYQRTTSAFIPWFPRRPATWG
jgi:steroid 5-alpha reductase family enzyme